MKLKTIALAGLAGTALIAGAAAVPAQAATKTTVSIHIQNANKTALKDVALTAVKGDSYVFVGSTNAKGNIAATAGLEGDKLSSGTWTFIVRDYNGDRFQKGTRYAGKSFKATLAAGKNTSLGTKTLEKGSRLSGKVTAPSGRAIVNAEVGALPSTTSQNAYDFSQTTSAGAYHLQALPSSKIYVSAYTGGKSASTPKAITIPKADSTTKGFSLSKIRVACSTGFTATSEAPGEVSIKVDASAEYFGLSNPGGSVAIKVDGTTIETVSFKDIATYSKTFTGQASGEHVYAVKYTGGDCYDWSKKSTVSVNVPS